MEEKALQQTIETVIKKLNSKDIYLYGPDFELYALLELNTSGFQEDFDIVYNELSKVAYNRSSYFYRYGRLNMEEIEIILRKMEKAHIYDENERFVRLIESVHPFYRKEVSNIYFKRIKIYKGSKFPKFYNVIDPEIEEYIEDIDDDLPPDLPF